MSAVRLLVDRSSSCPGATFQAYDRAGNVHTVDCRKVTCGVITVGAHGVANARNETFTPVRVGSLGAAARRPDVRAHRDADADRAPPTRRTPAHRPRPAPGAEPKPAGAGRPSRSTAAPRVAGNVLAFTATGLPPGAQVSAVFDDGAAGAGPFLVGADGSARRRHHAAGRHRAGHPRAAAVRRRRPAVGQLRRAAGRDRRRRASSRRPPTTTSPGRLAVRRCRRARARWSRWSGSAVRAAEAASCGVTGSRRCGSLVVAGCAARRTRPRGRRRPPHPTDDRAPRRSVDDAVAAVGRQQRVQQPRLRAAAPTTSSPPAWCPTPAGRRPRSPQDRWHQQRRRRRDREVERLRLAPGDLGRAVDRQRRRPARLADRRDVQQPPLRLRRRHRRRSTSAAGTAHVAWDGDVTVLYYSGMSFFYLSDPVLDVADGTAPSPRRCAATPRRSTTPTRGSRSAGGQVTVADLPDVDLADERGFVATPAYLGVARHRRRPGHRRPRTSGRSRRPSSTTWTGSGRRRSGSPAAPRPTRSRCALPLTRRRSTRPRSRPSRRRPQQPTKEPIENPVVPAAGDGDRHRRAGPVAPVAPRPSCSGRAPPSPPPRGAGGRRRAPPVAGPAGGRRSRAVGRVGPTPESDPTPIWWLGGGLLLAAALTLLVPLLRNATPPMNPR